VIVPLSRTITGGLATVIVPLSRTITGGLATVIVPLSRTIELADADLTLHGLRIAAGHLGCRW
jgi:hypothetical protein